MAAFDRGSGPPLVVVQGLHGRWEWTAPALAALSRTCRTVSYSLSGDLGSAMPARPDAALETYVDQLDRVLDDAHLDRVALCGVSFGGFVALRYAALHPDRVSALILASTPAPGWQPNAQQARWIAKPWLSAPVFVATAPLRVWPEVQAAYGATSASVRFLVRQGLRSATAPMIPSLMAGRIRMSRGIDVAADCARIRRPTLVVTGEEPLDRVVPVASTRTFCHLIAGATSAVVERTGHLGLLTRPARFAELVGQFVHANHH